MIKENQKLLNRLNVLSDAIIGFISVAAAFYIVFNLLDFDRNFPLVDYLKLAVVFVPVQLITFASLGLYDSFRTKKFSTEITKLAKAFIADGILVFTLLYTPCVAAIAAIRREVGSGARAAVICVSQCCIAWLAAFAVYHLTLLL